MSSAIYLLVLAFIGFPLYHSLHSLVFTFPIFICPFSHLSLHLPAFTCIPEARERGFRITSRNIKPLPFPLRNIQAQTSLLQIQENFRKPRYLSTSLSLLYLQLHHPLQGFNHPFQHRTTTRVPPLSPHPFRPPDHHPDPQYVLLHARLLPQMRPHPIPARGVRYTA